MKSLRHRLTLFLVCGLALLLAGGSAILYPVIRRTLVNELDDALLARARLLSSLLSPERLGVGPTLTETALPQFEPSPSAEYFQIWLSDGTVLARSASLGEANLPFPGAALHAPQFRDVALPDGRRGRSVTVGLASNAHGPLGEPAFVFLLARDRAHLDRALNGLLLGLTLGSGLLLVFAFAMVRLTVRSELQPVAALASQLTRVGAPSLATRLPVADLPLELWPVAEELNALLDRLEAAFEREKRFSANAAHELITPVRELRALAEAAQISAPDTANPLAAQVREIALSMQRTVDSLLELARCESGRTRARLETLDLSEMVREISAERAVASNGKDLQWEIFVPERLNVRSDATLLRCILANLIDNAAEHTPSRGTVKCRLATSGDVATFSLSNTNPGLTREDLPFLFEPLWRKDKVRTDRSHTGLGLALVRTCADRVNAQVQADLPDRTTVRFRFRVPLTPAPVENIQHPTSNIQ